MDRNLPRNFPLGPHPSYLQVPAVYSFLMANLPLAESTAQDIEKHWRCSAKQIESLSLGSPPTEICNLVISQACQARFSDARLQRVPGFYRDFDVWKLDLDPRLARRGILMPQRDRWGFFSSIQVFRHARDQYPFILKTRLTEVAAA